MNYTFEIQKINSKRKFLRVVYRTAGLEDIYQTFNPDDFAPAAIQALIDSRAGYVVSLWERLQNEPDVVEGDYSVGVEQPATYVKPTPPTPVEPTPEEKVELRIEAASVDRYQKEAEGILWTDSNGDDWMFDSSLDSQSRFTSATAAINKNSRTDGGVWKCASVDEVGELTLAFRPMTNQELGEVSDMVHDHVQKCFDAEAATVTKIMAGDMTANFAAEFAAL